MPGITIARGPRAENALSAAALADYERRELGADAGALRLAVIAYEAYPAIAIEREWGAAVLEGAAYGTPDVQIEGALASLGEKFAADPRAAREEGERWASGLDGDFVIAVVARGQDRALVINDRLGRLPLYWASAGGNTVVAREVKAVRAGCGAGEVDRHALAQMLLFSFPLGQRTLHAHIARIPEGSSVVIDSAGAVDVRRYHSWDFEELSRGGARDPDAAALAERFAERCAAAVRWCGSRPIVLGLSGGLDSRAVAAGLSRADARYSCVTFTSRRKKSAEEIETSTRIARALGVGWEEYALEAPSWSDARRLAQLRDGQSNIALAFMWEYFGKLVASFGPAACHFTGDGGDRVMPDLRAEIPIGSRQRFLDYRLANALWRVEDVAELVGLREEAIVGAVREQFETYPERDASFFNVRFMIAEWAFSRLFGGEDRNRAFVWNVAPFYCQSFFEAAMRMPVGLKRDYRLFAGFLRALDGRIAAIPKSNWGYAVTSPRVKLQAWRDAAASAIVFGLRGRRKLGSARAGRRPFGTPEHDPEFAALARGHRGAAFEPQALQALVSRGIDKLQFHMLATALLYVEDVWGGLPAGQAAATLTL